MRVSEIRGCLIGVRFIRGSYYLGVKIKGPPIFVNPHFALRGACDFVVQVLFPLFCSGRAVHKHGESRPQAPRHASLQIVSCTTFVHTARPATPYALNPTP